MPNHHTQPPPGTDALSQEDADALDAWLNDRALAQRGVAAAPASHDAELNGQVLSARQFHTRFAAAEEAETPDTPVDAIWEQVMANTLVAPAPASSPKPLTTARSQERRPTRHPMLVAVGSHPAATALLVAGVILAIVFVFRTFAHDPNAPIIDYGPAAMIPGGATATASPVAADARLPIPISECIKPPVAKGDQTLPDRAYTSPQEPTNTDAEAVNTSARALIACMEAPPTETPAAAPNQRQIEAMAPFETRRLILDDSVDRAEDRIAIGQDLSIYLEDQGVTALAERAPTDIIDPGLATWPAPLTNDKGDLTPGWYTVPMPNAAIQFPDGRIGMPFLRMITSDDLWANEQTLSYSYGSLMVFAKVDETWRLDDTIPVCVGDCAPYWQWLVSGTPTGTTEARQSSPASSPASPPAAACTVSVMSEDQAMALAANATPRVVADYLPMTGAVSAIDAQGALETFRGAMTCKGSEDIPLHLQRANLYSDAYSSRPLQAATPEGRLQLDEESLTLSKALAPILATDDTMTYVVDPKDPDVIPYLVMAPPDGTFPYGALLPEDFVRLPDGRIGAPLKTTFGVTVREGVTDYSSHTIRFIVYRNVGGQWLIDDDINVCVNNCDAYYAEWEQRIAEERSQLASSTPEANTGNPVASPAGTASPVADVWLQPIVPTECMNPVATATDDGEAAALLLRNAIACYEAGTPPSADNSAAFYSSDFLQRHPEIVNSGQNTLNADDIATAEAVSAKVAPETPELYVSGIPGADDHSDRTDGFYEIFLPGQNVIDLGDGRFAIPLTVALNDSSRATSVATNVAQTQSPVTFFAYVFTMENGEPRVDALVFGCIANCDGFWEQERTRIGTPSPSNEQLATEAATATAVAEAKHPIPSSECVVPTVSAGEETLPTRSYVPPLQPTDANATAVNQAARSFIACIEASPSPEATTPPATIQEVVAPFETDRLRAERDAADPSLPVQPTDEQITAGKSLSSYLESQGVTSFAERAPAGVVDPGISDWPGTILNNGQLADSTPGWYTVPMPNVVFQFPDGRIGIPALMMVTNDDLWTYIQGQPYTDGSLWIFAKVGDQWLLDEGIALCIGDCDAYWTQLATPLPPSEWLQPVQASECTPISASTYRDYVRPRDYMVVNTSARQDVARQSRAYAACMGWDTITPQASRNEFATSRHATEDTRRLSAEQIAGAKEFSAYYTNDGFSPYQRAPEGVDFRDAHTTTSQRADEGPIVYTPIFDPESAVGLSDGRVAIPTTYLIADDRSWNQAQGQPLPVTTTLTIWANVGGTWLIDEELPLCIGDCTSLWTYLESRTPNTPVATPTIPATPASTEASLSDDYWLAGPNEGLCKVLTSAGSLPATERAYLPWTQADTETGEQVARADRNRVACRQRDAGPLVPISGIYTTRYELPPAPGGAIDTEMLARMQDVSAAIPNQDPTAWIRLSQTSGGEATKPDTRYAVLPENVYMLPDGRYAAVPIVVFEGVGTADNNALMPNGYLAFPVSIYVHSGDTWRLDEQVSACLGDCGSYWASFRVLGAPSAPGTPSLPATPVVATTIDHRRITTPMI